VDTVLNTTAFWLADAATPDHWRALLEACQGMIFTYCALPPAISVTACQVLETVGLPEDTRLMLEKPFGSDADSAVELNELVNRLVPATHVNRIDQSVAMPTVLKVLGVRSTNRMLEPVFNNDHAERVDIVLHE